MPRCNGNTVFDTAVTPDREGVDLVGFVAFHARETQRVLEMRKGLNINGLARFPGSWCITGGEPLEKREAGFLV